MIDNKNKKINILSMDVKDIFVSIGKGNSKLPSKTQMNLYVKKTDGNSLSRVLPTAIILVVIVAAVYRIGVVNRLEKLNGLYSEISVLENTLSSYEEELADYDRIQLDYFRYTKFYLTDEESGLVKKTAVMDLIEESVFPYGTVVSTLINGDYVSLTVQTQTLKAYSDIRKALQKYDWISDVRLYSAAYNEKEENVLGSISFYVTK